MKTLFVVFTSACLAVAAWFVFHYQSTPSLPAAGQSQTVLPEPMETPSSRVAVPLQPSTPMSAPQQHAITSLAAPETSLPPTPAASQPKLPSLAVQQAVATIASAQSSYDQKQAAWKQLRDAGKLDEAITEFEQKATANPTDAAYPAALGQACLQKAGTLSDVREQGILGMKADQSFDAALNLDPSNWEAGFWKATALSYWPPQLGKGQEVIERFVKLIELQEAQPTQPQFAQTYVLLGEQYQKQGYTDYARQIWQRGATLFPSETKFQEKLAAPAAENQQTAAR